MQANVEEARVRATLAPKQAREVQRALAPLFTRDVVSRVVSGRHSYVELSDAIDGAPFRAIVEAVLERLIVECERVMRETQERDELHAAAFALNELGDTLHAMRDAGRSR